MKLLCDYVAMLNYQQYRLCYYVMMIYISDSNLLRIRYSWDMT